MGLPGSSPLARGLRGHHLHIGQGGRIIPARAGFTPAPARESGPRRDHPRSRGVYYLGDRVSPGDAGSSPLARGLLEVTVDGLTIDGIIPARAGFTTRASFSGSGLRDHPRSRGVYLAVTVGTAATAGSSPLARGLPHVGGIEVGETRIIPARAGFTLIAVVVTSGFADHPRSRGVYRSSTQPEGPSRGSSPLARGLPEREPASHGGPGIIPARAGFTLSAAVGEQCRGDHPRSRGVYVRPGALRRS